MIIDKYICTYNGSAAILSSAKPNGLVLHLSFDDDRPYDQSGHKNHGVNRVVAGPGMLGQGYSAMFNGYDFLELDHIPLYFLKQFTITFWYFMIKDDDKDAMRGVRYCPMLQKGVDDTFEKIYYR